MNTSCPGGAAMMTATALLSYSVELALILLCCCHVLRAMQQHGSKSAESFVTQLGPGPECENTRAYLEQQASGVVHKGICTLP